jgi:DNA-directed RNA polymerase subunit omega
VHPGRVALVGASPTTADPLQVPTPVSTPDWRPTLPESSRLMPDRHPTMMEPPVEELLDRVDSKFTLVSLAAQRGRQINSYFNQLGEGLGTVVPPQVTSISRKPLSIALEEIAAGKITYTRPDPGPEEDPEAEAES